MLPETTQPPPAVMVVDRASPRRPTRALGWIALGSGVAAGIGSAAAYALAHKSYDQYQTTDSESDANAFEDEAKSRLLTSRVLLGVGSALAVTGATMLIVDLVRAKKSPSNRAAVPLLNVRDNYVSLGLQGHF